MCGICGEVGRHQEYEVDRSRLERMCEVLRHRGPDDGGFYFDRGVGLGHRRLSVIDLSSGHQPMSNEDQSVWIVYNGEIYNYLDLRESLSKDGHLFKTNTDTEVIVHLYEEKGPDCVKDLQGMFAFALWDAGKQRLMLARDRLGQKPLFYADLGASFIFASESKALLQHDRVERRLNPLSVHDFLSFKFVPRQEDLFAGIHKLPPASVLLYERGRRRLDRYWELVYRPDRGMTEEDAVEGTDELLRESVRRRLMSDVPLGAFLSSGIDSGTVVGMMSAYSDDPVNTFSIGDETRGFNELPHARRIAERYQTRHREFIVHPETVSILPDLIWHLDGPYADIPALSMYYVSKLARQHVTVALTGDGGDESFAGYDRYVAHHILATYSLLPRFVRSRFVPLLLKGFREKAVRKSWRQSLRWFNSVSLSSRRERYGYGISFFSFENEEKSRLYTDDFRKSVDEANSLDGITSRFSSDHAENLLDRMTFTDLMVRMPEYSNVKVDRINMMHSLEARCPFMDHTLVEFAATIPARLKMKGRRRKHILRRAAERYLPPEVLNLPKQGFSSGINEWLRGDLRDFARSLLGDSLLVQRNMFRKEYIDRLMDDHEACRVNNGNKIWSLVNLESWYRIYFSDSDMRAARESLKERFHAFLR